MKKIVIGVFAYLLLFAVPSMGQMTDMDKHMKEHMGGGMGKSAEGKEETQAQNGFTKEAAQAEVTVKVTYLNPGKGSPEFKVTLDTHSVDLDRYKIEDVTILRDDKGKDYHPDLISASGTGHHREATVEFKDMDIPSAKYVELVIEDVAGVAERVFRFEIADKMMK